jgi:Nif-specific regulatory protein
MIGGRYRILQEIGSGGIGRVFKAVDQWKDRTVALKTLSLTGPDHTERFKKEFLLLRGLHHPHIVPVYDLGWDSEGQPHFSMEFIEGQEWGALLQSLDYSRLWPVILDICSTLDFLHCKGIIHGDIKPSNILVSSGPHGRLIPIFTDFGFAEPGKPEDSTWWKGTPSYLAPEIIRGERYTHQADLYSLGVLMYESIFGKPPFQEQELGQLARSHLEKEVIIPSEPAIPGGVEDLILNLLEKDPMDRCYSASEVRASLEEISGMRSPDYERSLAGNLISSADFAGRKRELFLLNQAFQQAQDNGNQVVLISGEPGIGKSSLLKEFVSRIELEQGLVLDLRLSKGISLETHRRKITRLLEDETFTKVLIVENLEQATDSPVEFLRGLLSQPEPHGVLLCLTVNNGFSRSDKDAGATQTEEALKSLLEDRLVHLRLERLTEPEEKKLVCSMFAWKQKQTEIASAVYQKAQGHPVLARQVFRQLAESGHLGRREDGWILEPEQVERAQVPPDLAQDLADRLSRLSPDELHLLGLACVLGLRFRSRMLKELSGETPEDFRKQFHGILAEGILLPQPGASAADGFCVNSGFVRDLILSQMEDHKAKELHSMVAGYLEGKQSTGTENHLEELAEHYYLAGSAEPALRYSLLAARRARDSGRAGQAIIHYLRVLELWDESPVPPEGNKKQVLRDLANQYECDGRYQKSIEYYQKSLDLAANESPRHTYVLRIQQKIAGIYSKMGQHDKATGLLDRMLPLADPKLLPVEHASVLIDLARERRATSVYHQAVEYLQEAIGLLQGLGPSKELGIGLNSLAGVWWAQGDYDQALDNLSQSLDVFDELGETREMVDCYIARALLRRSKGLPGEALQDSEKAGGLLKEISDHYRTSVMEHNLGIILTDLNRWDEALDCFKRNLQLKTQLGDVKGVALSHNSMGHVYLRKGRFTASGDQLFSALKMFQEARDRSGAALVCYNLADLFRCKENYQLARHYLDKSMRIAQQIGEESRIADCFLLSGKLHLDQSNWPKADQSLSEAASILKDGRNLPAEAELALAQAELCVGIGDLTGAEEHLKQAGQFAESSGSAWLEALLCQVWAELYRLRGDESACLDRLLQSLTTFKSLGARYQLGKTYLKLGRLKAKMGKVKEGRACLGEAVSILDKLEVENSRKEARALLDQTKEMPHPEKERIHTLYRLADLLNNVWDTDELLNKALDLVIELLNAERGAIILYSQKDGSFRVKASRKLELETSKDAVAISRRVVNDVIKSDSPLIVDNATSNPQFAASKSVITYNILSILCVPLRTQNRLIGTVYLDHRSLPAVFSSEDIDFLKAFACLIATAIEKSELYTKLHEEVFQLKETLHQYHEYPHLVGKSAKMQEVFGLVEKVAPSKTSVLILGEAGTGKELIAHLIHERSPRRAGPFIRVNCAALAESMLEGELFGIEDKAATGVGFRKGKFELADGGTIFLDEVGDMSLSLQAKVLRVLQEKEFDRVGGQESVSVDIRVISATNQDLQKKVQDGDFRLDLFYRLNTIVISIPPLRERKEDIPLLVQHFAQIFAKEMNKPQVKLTKRTMAALQALRWNGSNVRELKNLIERATLLSEKGEFPSDLLRSVNVIRESADLNGPRKLQELLNWVEKNRIIQALERNGWNQLKAAEELGLNETTLRRRMKKHRIKKSPRL